MTVADQSEVVSFLSDAANWPQAAEAVAVERIETHGSIIFLGGRRVLKLKRAVHFDFMDFSTPERRHDCCAAELTLNRRTAPSLYRALHAVTRENDGRLAPDGKGPPVDWLVEMDRFDQSGLFDNLAGRGALTLPLVERLTDIVAAFHASAARCEGPGAAAAMRDIVVGNRDGMQPFLGGALDRQLAESIITAQLSGLDRLGPELEARGHGGYVRRCHGDLHLGNICLVKDAPTLFDCIEFNDRLAVIDVLYDAAFLVMDLIHRDLVEHAATALGRYFAHQQDLDGLAALPLFLSIRAMVRAKVTAALAAGQPAALAEKSFGQAASYLALADGVFSRHPLRLVAVGGLSGSGKSTLARSLAPLLDAPPGALVLRSDVLRKCLLGCSPSAPLGPEGYTADVTAHVYAELAVRSRQALAAGRSVVVDAVHARAEERADIEKVAREAGARFEGLWLTAPDERLAGRLTARRDDASDATVAVLAHQRTYDVGEIAWTRLDATPDPAAVVAAAKRRLAMT